MTVLLMCTPQGFAVNYEINPWMKHHIGQVSSALAASQWQGLFERLSCLAEIRLMRGTAEWPDLVFTANAGLPVPGSKTIILSNFRHPQRQGEKALNRAWFEAQGWTCIDLPDSIAFEGAGDALFDSRGTLWLGNGPRSDAAALPALSHHIRAPIQPLEMVDPAFYHLDTCFCPLPDGFALYLPQAFSDQARARLAHAFGDHLLPLTPEEGKLFCANAVCVGGTVVMNQPTARLVNLLGERGFAVVASPLGEFLKSGGGAKCLSLCLENEPVGQRREAAAVQLHTLA